jgi:chromate transporter
MNALLYGSTTLSGAEWWALFAHFLMLSMLAIGGAMVTAPDMHRYLVQERGWLSAGSFTDSVAIAQAAPGPNVLFVAVLGFQVAGLAGAAVAMAGSLLPSTVVALQAARWLQHHRQALGVRAFKAGLAPITIGLLLSTGWLLSAPARTLTPQWPLLGLMAASVLLSLHSKLSPVWMILAGGLAALVFGW